MNNLKCYCCKKKSVVQINSEEYNKWKEKYIKDFNSSYISTGEYKSGVKAHYTDPDGTYDCDESPFFRDLETFLKKQENKESQYDLNGKFDYSFVKGKGIKVIYDNKILFYLRSDQLGFSAPSNSKNHPYDFYLIRSNDINKFNNVVNWLSYTRTLGGSFLWPKSLWSSYNSTRGRTPYEDRADLALLDIKELYSKLDYLKDYTNHISLFENSKHKLLQCINHKNYLDTYNWFNHFKDFSTYANFFYFKGDDSFVDKNNQIKSLIDESKSLSIPRKKEITSIYKNKERDIEDLVHIFNRLIKYIKTRSNKMN